MFHFVDQQHKVKKSNTTTASKRSRALSKPDLFSRKTFANGRLYASFFLLLFCLTLKSLKYFILFKQQQTELEQHWEALNEINSGVIFFKFLCLLHYSIYFNLFLFFFLLLNSR